ncbi:hypothetical protein GCM10027062_02640 [Nocardioides hungaricus]
MTWGFRAQRRADEFDALVEGLSTIDPTAGRDADLLELVGALRATPEIHARPEFVADLRVRLMAEAATALVPADLSRLRLPERRPRRERRLAAVVGGIAIVGATTSVAVAAQSALPGDTLYPIKRAIEGAHTGLSVGEGSKGTTALANAANRLAEVEALTGQDGVADDLRIAQTLNDFTDQATQASDLLLSDYASSGDGSSIAALRDFSSTSLDQLAALEPLVPADARDELIRAAQVLQTIDAEAAQRCPTCGGAPIDSIPPVLVSAEQVFVPVAPKPSVEPADTGPRNPGKQGGTGNEGRPTLPSVGPDDVGPGSVTNPSAGPGLPDSTTVRNPLQQLAEDLTGGLTGGGKDKPSDRPSVPVVGPLLGTVGDLLESIVDPLTGQGAEER